MQGAAFRQTETVPKQARAGMATDEKQVFGV
jgi:hypothetical protein